MLCVAGAIALVCACYVLAYCPEGNFAMVVARISDSLSIFVGLAWLSIAEFNTCERIIINTLLLIAILDTSDRYRVVVFRLLPP